jgi:hypothetical protein
VLRRVDGRLPNLGGWSGYPFDSGHADQFRDRRDVPLPIAMKTFLTPKKMLASKRRTATTSTGRGHRDMCFIERESRPGAT